MTPASAILVPRDGILVSAKVTLPILGIDLETTGLKQQDGDRIVEIAMVEMLYETWSGRGFIKRSLVQRVNPLRPIHPAAEAVHGISMAMLKDEPVWEDVASRVLDFMQNVRLLVAHNMEFDGPFLAGELLRVGLRPPEVPTLCTMKSARWATSMGKLPKLSELCFASGVSYNPEEAHSAEYDIKRTLACLKRGLANGYYHLPEESL